jgi:hypothetical protein
VIGSTLPTSHVYRLAMYFRFRRSLSLFPGIKLNLNKSTPSLTVGERGAHLTLGKGGAAVGAGIPGTGMSLRQRLPLPLHDVATAKPKFWEFILLQRGLTMILEKANPLWEEAMTAGIDPASFITEWLPARIDQISLDAGRLKEYLTTDLMEALGPTGVPADEEKLCSVLESVAQLTEELIGWEQEIRAYVTHPLYGDLAEALSGFTKPLLDSIGEVKEKLDKQIPGLQKGGKLDLTFTVQAPNGADALNAKMGELPERVKDSWSKNILSKFQVSRGNTPLGSFSVGAIHENLAAELFLPDDWFWSAPLNDWKPLAELDETPK